ncbi:hypothetical protein WB980_006009 [Bacillus cereus]|uniref:hypothetical protein n=1 Tax=Bacillus thuringiensis TaxID=1428 RepID=UPI00115AB410|nr:hypothetical protein [Bacillus thuringiensis]
MQTYSAFFFNNSYINFSPQSAPPLLEGLLSKLVNLSFCSTSAVAGIFNSSVNWVTLQINFY